MILFLLVLIGVWAMPTHYAARLLVDTDRRLQKSLSAPPSSEFECLKGSSVWVPRVLGFLTFVAVLIAIFRSYLNLPNLDQKEVITAVGWSLVEMALLVLAGAVGFGFYVIYRPRHVDLQFSALSNVSVLPCGEHGRQE